MKICFYPICRTLRQHLTKLMILIVPFRKRMLGEVNVGVFQVLQRKKVVGREIEGPYLLFPQQLFRTLENTETIKVCSLGNLPIYQTLIKLLRFTNSYEASPPTLFTRFKEGNSYFNKIAQILSNSVVNFSCRRNHSVNRKNFVHVLLQMLWFLVSR